jgi:hypothetical protein
MSDTAVLEDTLVLDTQFGEGETVLVEDTDLAMGVCGCGCVCGRVTSQVSTQNMMDSDAATMRPIH